MTSGTVDVRYTEWVQMSYPAGKHVANWSSFCARELYLYDTGEAGERRHVDDDVALAHVVRDMRKRLHAGWRTAMGALPWPVHLPDATQTQIDNCGPAGLPQPSSSSLCNGSVAQCIEARGNVNYNAAPELDGFPQIVATALACEEACMAHDRCASGLWLSGSVRHGDCYLTAGTLLAICLPQRLCHDCYSCTTTAT
eukprot:COSAG01_NODE_19711_length_994_cov_0.925140_1_plen_197_part_00